MQVDEHGDESAQQLRTLSLLAGSLLLGMMSFVVMAVVMGPSGMGVLGGGGSGGAVPGSGGGVGGGGGVVPGGQASPIVLLLGALGVMSAGCYGAFVAYGKVAQEQARAKWEAREDDEAGRAAVVRVLFVSTVVRAAFAESPGVLAGTIMLIGGGLLPLGIVGVSALLLVSLLPVRSRLMKLEERAMGVWGGGGARDGGRGERGWGGRE